MSRTWTHIFRNVIFRISFFYADVVVVFVQSAQIHRLGVDIIVLLLRRKRRSTYRGWMIWSKSEGNSSRMFGINYRLTDYLQTNYFDIDYSPKGHFVSQKVV